MSWTVPLKVEGHPPMWISRAAMADPAAAQPYEFEDKLYWVQGEAPLPEAFNNYIDATIQAGVNLLTKDLVAKSRALVTLLDDAEVNHGGLYSGKTMRAIGELRLELARWGSGK